MRSIHYSAIFVMFAIGCGAARDTEPGSGDGRSGIGEPSACNDGGVTHPDPPRADAGGDPLPAPDAGGLPTTPPDLEAKFPGSKLFVPANATASTPAVVLLHGSEGGTDPQGLGITAVASMLAKDAKVVALALCWFGCPGTPDKVFHIKLEQVRDAAVWLKALPVVGNAKVGLFGWSRGGEMSVLMASLLASTDPFAAVAVHAPSDTIVAAYDPATQDTVNEPDPVTGQPRWGAAWSWNNKLLFGDRTWTAPGPRIEIEKYAGPLWVSHGVKDDLWEVQRSYRLVASRTAAGLPTETHYWQDEGHIIKKPSNNQAFDASLAAFMRQHLAP